MNKIDVPGIREIEIECRECGARLTFAIREAAAATKEPHHCPICGNNYGIDPVNNPAGVIRRAIESAERAKGSRISILCEELGDG